MAAIRILEYIDSHGSSPWTEWHRSLDAEARAKVATALYRMAEGNFSNVKGVGAGVFERVLDWGPGYRIYFGKDGDTIVILLGGSTKKGQQRAIDAAKRHWDDYRQRKATDKTWH
jgi:putative addiction module killer protein